MNNDDDLKALLDLIGKIDMVREILEEQFGKGTRRRELRRLTDSMCRELWEDAIKAHDDLAAKTPGGKSLAELQRLDDLGVPCLFCGRTDEHAPPCRECVPAPF